MSDAHDSLIQLLSVESLEVDLFRGIGSGGETPTRIFGGQVIGQALSAAYQTVPARLCHSLHAYFIRAGDPTIPVIYQVDRARDGGSFTTRRVVAIQHGKQILNMSASFHITEQGWSHHHKAPEVDGPAGLEDRSEQRKRTADKMPEKYRADYLRERPIDIREVAPRDYFAPEPASDVNHLWFRMKAAAGCKPQMQHCLLAYASDMNLLGSSLRPHGLTWFKGNVMTASLDHTMRFHGAPAFHNRQLYTKDRRRTRNARGFTRRAIYAGEGDLVASVAQEGLMRPVDR